MNNSCNPENRTLNHIRNACPAEDPNGTHMLGILDNTTILKRRGYCPDRTWNLGIQIDADE